MQKLHVHEWAGFSRFGGVPEFVHQRAEFSEDTRELVHYIDGQERARVPAHVVMDYCREHPECAVAVTKGVPDVRAMAAPAKPAAKPKPKGKR